MLSTLEAHLLRSDRGREGGRGYGGRVLFRSFEIEEAHHVLRKSARLALLRSRVSLNLGAIGSVEEGLKVVLDRRSSSCGRARATFREGSHLLLELGKVKVGEQFFVVINC